MLRINVAGGTDAGRRVVRPVRGEWAHVCDGWPDNRVKGRTLTRVYARCPFCGCKRP